MERPLVAVLLPVSLRERLKQRIHEALGCARSLRSRLIDLCLG